MIAWTDIETTGLDERDRDAHILEVAVVVTDDELNFVDEINVIVSPVGTDVEALKTKLDPVVVEMHTKNGLFLDAVERGMRRHDATAALVKFAADKISSNAEELKKVPLAGSTVHFDKKWLREHMPAFECLFSYRTIDVSSITELAKRWDPKLYEARPKGDAHRALADIKASIEVLRYYRVAGFIGGGKVAP